MKATGITTAKTKKAGTVATGTSKDPREELRIDAKGPALEEPEIPGTATAAMTAMTAETGNRGNQTQAHPGKAREERTVDTRRNPAKTRPTRTPKGKTVGKGKSASSIAASGQMAITVDRTKTVT